MAVHVHPVELGAGIGAWFTGRDRGSSPLPLGTAGNLSHRRPHRPVDLARARAEVGRVVGVPPGRWHLMRQVHGSRICRVEATTPPGAELRDVDALVTDQSGRPLAVQVADCVPVLLADDVEVAVVHAGRDGVVAGVVAATVTAMRGGAVRAVVGPAIGACCYEVPARMRDEVSEREPAAHATTTWGTPALDLRSVVQEQLVRSGVGDVEHLVSCTRCDPDQRWFSHRRDPGTGRQMGLVVRHGPAGAS